MYKLTYALLLLAIIFACSSCSNKQYQILFQQKKALSGTDSSAKYASAAPALYHVQPGDLLQIRNLQDTKFITNMAVATSTSTPQEAVSNGETFQVAADSTVNLPVVGKLRVVGLTRVGAQNLVQDAYAKALLVNPIIELKIPNLKVTLFGEIKAPGNYQLVKDQTTLVELLGQAGGLTDKADEKDIKIIRGTEKNPDVINVDLGDLTAIYDPKTILRSGDIIYVAQNKRAVRSDNLQSFSVILQPALILFNTALIIFTLVRK